jgi:hypothetical protein
MEYKNEQWYIWHNKYPVGAGQRTLQQVIKAYLLPHLKEASMHLQAGILLKAIEVTKGTGASTDNTHSHEHHKAPEGTKLLF